MVGMTHIWIYLGSKFDNLTQNLARRLATIRETISRKSPVTAIHLTDSNGKTWIIICAR